MIPHFLYYTIKKLILFKIIYIWLLLGPFPKRFLNGTFFSQCKSRKRHWPRNFNMHKKYWTDSLHINLISPVVIISRIIMKPLFNCLKSFYFERNFYNCFFFFCKINGAREIYTSSNLPSFPRQPLLRRGMIRDTSA